MVWQRPGRRALIATFTVVAALLPISLVAAVAAFGDAPSGGGNSGAGPAIVGFSPHQGTIRGGTVVHISGGGFTDVTAVSFGGRAAASFEVKSANLIDAVTPAVPRGAGVRIGIAAAGGSSVSNAPFTFIGCHVPRVKDDAVRRARKTVVAAGCRVGQVTRARNARAPLQVVAESPRPGAWLEPGAPVTLRVR
jgi:IPT/TIG domain